MICSVWPKCDKQSWDQAKILMGNPDFLPTIRDHFPLDTLTSKKMKMVEDIIDGASKDKDTPLSPEDVQKASVAAAELYRWINCLRDYWAVAKDVEPKKKRVAELRREQESMERQLAVTQADIAKLNEHVAELEQQLEEGLATAEKLRKQAEVMTRRLNAARQLITGFTSERSRWHTEMGELKSNKNKLYGDCLLGAAFMSYSGAFTYPFRCETLDIWIADVKAREIPSTDPFNLRRLMTTDVQSSQWVSEGLPTDELSIQNGILVVESTRPLGKDLKKSAKVRFPLCIDPQQQAVNWIKRRYADHGLEVATFSDPDFLKRLEACIQYGKPFLFENVDEFIDPIVDSVLDPQFTEESGQRTVRVGDKSLTWDENFKLHLCTKLANPNYPAEVFGKTLVVNCSVTRDGLESQLLNTVVAHERADIQKLSDELVQSMAADKANLKQLEDTLIRELSLATGNILDNQELIETLETTKSQATEVNKKLEQAQRTAEQVEESRQAFRPVARRGAILFFAIAQLSSINIMYEYSLGAFSSDVFEMSLDKADTVLNDAEKRNQNVMEYLNYCLYAYVCMGVFEKHKLMFSLLMTLSLKLDEKVLQQSEVDFFLRGCVIAAEGEFPPNPTALPQKQWDDLCKLAQTVPVFKNLPTEVRENLKAWEAWYGQDRPDDITSDPIPSGYALPVPPPAEPELDEAGEPIVRPPNPKEISSFQRLCLLRCFRPDRVYSAVSHYVGVALGERFTVPPIVSYQSVYKQSSCNAPIVCVVSPGANPTDEIYKLAEKLEVKHIKSISLGQGQGEEAMSYVQNGSIRGHWVLLQNCHLLVKWMKELEKSLEKRDQAKPHQDYRLWLTTEPTSDFPLGILQRSLKVVNEPPNGLKMNMKSTMSKISEEQLEHCPHWAFRPLVYTLAFFHAVVQERRKYNRLGFNCVYDFNETDAAISMSLVDTYLTKAFENDDPLPWPTLRYLVGEAMYGGRVTDSMDRRVVTAYLEEYLGDFLFDTFQPFHFYADDKVDYCLPKPSSEEAGATVTYQDMLDHIDRMPLENTPDVFGLHPNAETGYLIAATNLLWENLIELMPRQSGGDGAGSNADEELYKMTDFLLEKVPKEFLFDRAQTKRGEIERAKREFSSEFLQPTQVVLLQEIDQWNRLVVVMRASLQELQLALKGVIGMSQELDELATALNNGQLPQAWRIKAPATRKALTQWLNHFERRQAQFDKWRGPAGEPHVMWFAGLRFPESYISALVQTTCRKKEWPLDKSTVFTSVTKFKNASEIDSRPEDGAYLEGLYLEGARWNLERGFLEAQEKKTLIYDLPVLKIEPIEVSKLKLVNTLRTPLYVTRDRRNAAGVGLVMETQLASDKHPSHWLLESVALILNDDY